MTNPTIFGDKVTCGTWTFNDPMNLPGGVTQLGVNILDGWDDTGPLDALVSSRGTRDGDVPADHFPSRSRTVTLSGWIYCSTRLAANQARTAMVRDAFPRDVDLTLTRYEPDAVKFLTVRRAGPVEIAAATNVTGPHFRFLVPLQAFDPLKYSLAFDINATAGVAGTSNGGLVVPVKLPAVLATGAGAASNLITVFNAGSHESKPTTTINGPLPTGWHWDNATSGESFRLDVSLGVADALVLNHALESAILNGFPIAAAIVGDWWAVSPGNNALRLYGDFDAAAGVTILGRSAWE